MWCCMRENVRVGDENEEEDNEKDVSGFDASVRGWKVMQEGR